MEHFFIGVFAFLWVMTMIFTFLAINDWKDFGKNLLWEILHNNKKLTEKKLQEAIGKLYDGADGRTKLEIRLLATKLMESKKDAE